MLNINEAVYPSAQEWKAVIRGMRNPMNSWGLCDSVACYGTKTSEIKAVEEECRECPNSMWYFGETIQDIFTCPECEKRFEGCAGIDLTRQGYFRLGKNDINLARRLIGAGNEHMKFLRQLPVTFDMTAPLYWWKQLDTYSVGTTTDSCSTMHKLTDKEFELSDFSFEHFEDIDKIETDTDLGIDLFYGERCGEAYLEHYIIPVLNSLREDYIDNYNKNSWYAINEFLPQSYNQLRTWSANYAVLFNICAQRAGHKLSEWETLIRWIVEDVPHFKELCFDRLCEISLSFKRMFDEE